MIVVLKQNPNRHQLESLIAWLQEKGIIIHTSIGEANTILGLVGDTTALTVSNPDAKEIVFSDPSQLPEDTTFYIVPGDTADFLLTLAADVDPEATFVYCYFDGNQACVLDYAGEGGYAFSSGIDSMETTGYSYADVFVYNSLDPDNALAHIMYLYLIHISEPTRRS